MYKAGYTHYYVLNLVPTSTYVAELLSVVVLCPSGSSLAERRLEIAFWSPPPLRKLLYPCLFMDGTILWMGRYIVSRQSVPGYAPGFFLSDPISQPSYQAPRPGHRISIPKWCGSHTVRTNL